MITFIKPNILDYFYNGDKFKILLVRLKKSMFKTEEEKNCIFQKLLSNDIETGNKNDKKNKKPKPKIETEEKAIEKETVVEEKSQKEIQKEQLLKVTHIISYGFIGKIIGGLRHPKEIPFYLIFFIFVVRYNLQKI